MRTVHEGQGLVEADRSEHCAQRLAGLGRIDGQGGAGEVLFLVLLGLGPLDDLDDLFFRVLVLEILLLVLEHRGVFRLAEQHFVVDEFIC